LLGKGFLDCGGGGGGGGGGRVLSLRHARLNVLWDEKEEEKGECLS
jgi:hypothetical protein